MCRFSSWTLMGWIKQKLDIPDWTPSTPSPFLEHGAPRSISWGVSFGEYLARKSILCLVIIMIYCYVLHPMWCWIILDLNFTIYWIWPPSIKVVESYFILEPDVPKDSSTEVTCILRALDHAKAVLDKRQIPMPEHLIIEVGDWKNVKHQKSSYCLKSIRFNYMLEIFIIYVDTWHVLFHVINLCPATLQTDNCVREGKNQVVAKASATAVISGRFLASIIFDFQLIMLIDFVWINLFPHCPFRSITPHWFQPRFRSVTHIFGEVGHTHGPVDQRLSICTAAFGAADIIQSPEDVTILGCVNMLTGHDNDSSNFHQSQLMNYLG